MKYKQSKSFQKFSGGIYQCEDIVSETYLFSLDKYSKVVSKDVDLSADLIVVQKKLFKAHIFQKLSKYSNPNNLLYSIQSELTKDGQTAKNFIKHDTLKKGFL